MLAAVFFKRMLNKTLKCIIAACFWIAALNSCLGKLVEHPIYIVCHFQLFQTFLVFEQGAEFA